MKTIFLLAMVFCFSGLQAQTWDEWVHQKETQKKYLLQQIAAFETQLLDIKKGYNVVSSGVSAIGSLARGEFDLHGAFFTSLGRVNPTIKQMAEVAQVVAMQVKIVRLFRGLLAGGGSDAVYIGRVYDRVVKACTDDLDVLADLLADGKLQMSDAERMRRIHGVYVSMEDRLGFTKSFVGEAGVLGAQRAVEQAEVNRMRQLYK